MRENRYMIWMLIAMAMLLRLAPHIPSTSPAIPTILLGSAFLPKGWQRILGATILFWLSDIVLTNCVMHWSATFVVFYPGCVMTYLSLIVIATLSMPLWGKRNLARAVGFSVVASVIFFLLSNLGSWWTMPIYSKDAEGLIECYVAALPYFKNSLISNAVYTTIIFSLAIIIDRYAYRTHRCR